MLNSLIFKHYDFAGMEKVRENALISLFQASFYCGKEAKTLAKTSFRVVFSGRECYFLHLALFRSRAFLEDYCTSGRVSFLLREFTADGCHPSTDALKLQKFYSSLPTFIPTASFKNSVFHKISIPFACPLALLPPSFCGVKSEIRPDVNKKNSQTGYR